MYGHRVYNLGDTINKIDNINKKLEKIIEQE